MTSLHICYPNTCFTVVFKGRKRHFCFNITVIRTEIGDFFMMFAYILHMAYKLLHWKKPQKFFLTIGLLVCSCVLSTLSLPTEHFSISVTELPLSKSTYPVCTMAIKLICRLLIQTYLWWVSSQCTWHQIWHNSQENCELPERIHHVLLETFSSLDSS